MRFPRIGSKDRGRGRVDPSSGGFTTRQMTGMFVALALATLLSSPAARAATARLVSVAITDPSNTSQVAHVDASGNLQVGGNTTLLAHGENVPIPSNMTTVIVPDLDISADKEIRLPIRGDFPNCNLAEVEILTIPPVGTSTYIVDEFPACPGFSNAVYELVGMTVRIVVFNSGISNDGTVSFFLVGRSN